MMRVTTARVKQPYFATSAKVAIAQLVAQLGTELRGERNTLW